MPAQATNTALAARLLSAAARLNSDRDEPAAQAQNLYSTVLEAGRRLLEDVEDGQTDAEAWTWLVMQEQVPALREAAGLELDSPDPLAEREREIRERFGLPAPVA